MNTLEERKAEILAKAEKEIREAETEAEIREAWPLDIAPRFIHIYPLYGTVASVDLGDSDPHKRQTWTVNEAIAIAERLDPEAGLLVKDGCTSFRLASDVPEDFDDSKLTAVCPYWLRLSHFGDKLEFYAKVGGHMCRVSISVSDPEYRVSARRVNYPGGYRYEDSSPVYPRDHFTHSVKWSRGSDEYPNNFTLYTY